MKTLQKPFKNSQHTNTQRGHLVRPSQSSYEVVWRLYPMNLHLPCEKRPSQTFKTANIPTPGEVIWYAHHNPVTRWYEGCILIYIYPVKKEFLTKFQHVQMFRKQLASPHTGEATSKKKGIVAWYFLDSIVEFSLKYFSSNIITSQFCNPNHATFGCCKKTVCAYYKQF